MSISSDEVNFLIFRYLSENGEHHSYANYRPIDINCATHTSRSHHYRIFPFCVHFRARVTGGEIQHRSNRNPTRRIDHIFAKGFGIHRHRRAHQRGTYFIDEHLSCSPTFHAYKLILRMICSGWLDPRIRQQLFSFEPSDLRGHRRQRRPPISPHRSFDGCFHCWCCGGKQCVQRSRVDGCDQ